MKIKLKNKTKNYMWLSITIKNISVAFSLSLFYFYYLRVEIKNQLHNSVDFRVIPTIKLNFIEFKLTQPNAIRSG